MRWSPFTTRAPGKWILAGEHAVLRGGAAIALPHPDLGLTLTFNPESSRKGLRILPPEAAVVIRDLLSALPFSGELSGVLEVQSTIPWGAGLGSSAALCVALTRWISGPLDISRSDWLDFATKLENRFHGKSSGMDIAVILAGEPVRFTRGQRARPLSAGPLPNFTFHDTGIRARTSDCVALVETFLREHPAQGARLDELMSQAALHAEQGLKLYGSGKHQPGLEKIARAMAESDECFEGWGLIPPGVRELQRSLTAQGARATKLTGSGGGGMVVALWEDAAPSGIFK